MIRIVVMASGYSRRMGQEKLLVPIDGKPLIQWVIEAALEAESEGVYTIYRTPEIELFARRVGTNVIYNPLASQGQSAAIRLAAEQLMPESAVLFLAGDQPLVKAETLRRLMTAYREQEPDAAGVCWKDGLALPSLFSPNMRENLLALEGNLGARRLMDPSRFRVIGVPPCEDAEQWDIDTEAQRERIERWLHDNRNSGTGQ